MGSRAVVLGGGGHTGFGWQWGVITGLHEAGIDLATAELIVGTSSGAMAAAHVASGVPPQKLMSEISEPISGHNPQMELPNHTFTSELTRLIKGGYTAAEMFAALGALALRVDGASELTMREIAATYLPHLDWPQPRLLIPAIDVESGEFVVFDQESGVALVDAVSASCAVPGVWEPVTIGERRYMDPFVRSPINADLAAGFEEVVVIAPIPEVRGVPGGSLDEQLTPVKDEGNVVLIGPDATAMAAIGRNQQDLSQRPGAARAGFAQAASLVELLS